jgi:putative transposase
VPHAVDWLAYVNEPQSEAEVEALRECIRRRRPYGDEAWVERTAQVMGTGGQLAAARPAAEDGQVAGTLFA